MRRFAPIVSNALQWIVIALACLLAATRPAKGAAWQQGNLFSSSAHHSTR
jgi:hypothetical protein